jgi:hypothetical protein
MATMSSHLKRSAGLAAWAAFRRAWFKSWVMGILHFIPNQSYCEGSIHLNGAVVIWQIPGLE